MRAALGAVVVVIAGLCIYSMRQADPDLFGYLVYGRLFAQHGGPIQTDPFAYTSAGAHWIPFEYVAQMLLWTAYARLGPAGLLGVKMALGGIALLFLWRAVRAGGADAVVCAPIFLLCASTVSRYFLFRPQLVTFACFALFVSVLFRFLCGRRTALWVLPLVMLVWANSHGGFVAGLGAIALALGLRICVNVNATREGPRAWHVGVRPLALTWAACLAVTFVNPQGAGLWRYVLTELSHGTNRRYIAEWSPAGRHVDPWSFAALTVLSLTLFAVGWLAERRRLMVAGIRAWQWILSAAPLIAMSYGAVRHVPLAATWAAPVITAIAGRLSASAAAPAFRRLWTAVGSVALVPIVLTIEFVLARPGPAIAMGAATLGSKDPCRVAAFMRQNDVRGNVYTPLWWGSYLTWEAYPAIRVSMDGRNISLFPDAMVGENLRFYSRDAGPADLDSPFRYDTDFLLVPADAAILPRVRDDRRWRRIYADDDAQLFVRAGDSRAAMQAPLVFSTPPCPSTLPAAAQLQ